jgi:2-polyprenyl-3-methyl-5-hydroxy-6-metoxy-1,4-benzoquinol methylase
VKHDLEKINSCPVCGENKFSQHLSCIDHNYSGDVFNIVCCESCDFKFTNPRPKEKTVFKYYQSDDYISHTSSKKGLFNSAYHIVRNYQFGKKYSLINKLVNKKDRKILDVGSGTGEFLNFFKQKGWGVRGLETDDKAREFAIKNFNCEVDKSIKQTLENKEKFDVITLWHVLEHVYDINDYLSKLKNLLSENGYIVLGLPNCNSYDAKYYKESWYAYDLPIHVSHFTKQDIKKLVNKHNFQSLTIKPLIFDAYYISLLSSKKSGSNLIRGVLNGWLSNTKAKKSLEYSSLIYILKS